MGNYVVSRTTRESLRRSAEANAGEIKSPTENIGYRRGLGELYRQLDYLIFASIRGIVDGYLDAVGPSERSDYKDNAAPFLDPIDTIIIGGALTEELTTFALILTFDSGLASGFSSRWASVFNNSCRQTSHPSVPCTSLPAMIGQPFKPNSCRCFTHATEAICSRLFRAALQRDDKSGGRA